MRVPGDTLVMYTDGLYERREDPADGMDRLSQVASGLHHLPVDQAGRHLADEMLADRPIQDDVCILLMRRPAVPN